ncbi:MAG: hypothetical protein IKN36_00640 [Clostridia bacterium]|nr:hypothetical protein [Clostridia bacterium]MBR7032531.1 hypothetical protein [Clostridia bacterium]
MAKKIGAYSLLFSSFMFIQLVFLRLGNQAGLGLLPGGLAEQVYYLIQVFVILGFALFAIIKKASGTVFQRVGALCSVAFLAHCTLFMLFIPPDTFAALILTAVGSVHLGFVGGCVYLKMAEAAHGGVRVEICMAVGCSSAILLQYLLQLEWTLAPVLAILSAASAVCLALSLFRRRSADDVRPAAVPAGIPAKTIVFTSLIAAALLLFPSFFNGYIHHLQIASGYTEYNVYTWPRLMMIPAYMLFGTVATVRRGRYLPITALCAAIAALLNSVLVWSGVGYLVNMCLFYVAIAASVAYYDLVFWRIAMRTKRPEIWASAGRILDSACVLAAGAARISALPVVAVVSVDAALLAATIVLMALNGDFNFSHRPDPLRPAAPGTDPFPVIRDRYGFTDSETRVFRELVLTEDKQTAIGDRLSIKLRTVQANVTSIYRKTGASTRSGLVQIYRDTVSSD